MTRAAGNVLMVKVASSGERRPHSLRSRRGGKGKGYHPRAPRRTKTPDSVPSPFAGTPRTPAPRWPLPPGAGQCRRAPGGRVLMRMLASAYGRYKA